MATEPQTESDTQSTASAQSKRSSWRLLGQRICSITPSELTRFCLFLLALGAVGWLIWTTWSALWPFQVGIIAAYLMLPLVRRLEQYMSRLAAVFAVYGIFLLIVLVILTFVVPPLVAQIIALPDILPDIDEFSLQMDDFITAFERFINTLPVAVRQSIDDGLEQAFETIRNNLLVYVSNIAAFLVNTVLSVVNTFGFFLGLIILPFWLFYVLNDEREGIQALDALLPPWARADFWAFWQMIDRILSSYLRGQVFLGFIIGIATYLGLTALEFAGVEGIQSKLLLAVLAGVMELIPYIGPTLAAVPAIIIGMLHSWESALIITLMYLVIQQIEGNLLIPRIVGETVNIHPAILMVVLLALAQFGFIWIVVSAPLAAILRDIFLYVYGRVNDPPRPAGLLPGEELPAEEAQPQAMESSRLSPEASES